MKSLSSPVMGRGEYFFFFSLFYEYNIKVRFIQFF
nr:MAG TPA: hypothetical protein [Caudoviricetes sp.]